MCRRVHVPANWQKTKNTYFSISLITAYFVHKKNEMREFGKNGFIIQNINPYQHAVVLYIVNIVIVVVVFVVVVVVVVSRVN